MDKGDKENSRPRYIILPNSARISLPDSNLRAVLMQSNASQVATTAPVFQVSARPPVSVRSPALRTSSASNVNEETEEFRPTTSSTEVPDNFKWTEEYRRALVEVCIQMNVKKLAFSKKWQKVADELNRRFGLPLTGKQCKNQWTKELQRYRDIINPPTGTSRQRPFPFFDLIQNYIGDDPTIAPVHLVSTSQPISENTDLNISFSKTSEVDASSQSNAPTPKRRKVAALPRRVPKKTDLLTLLNECRRQNSETKEEVMKKYNEINDRQCLFMERIIRLEESRIENEAKMLKNDEMRVLIEEKRVANEAKLILLEEKRVENESKMLSLLNKFADDLV